MPLASPKWKTLCISCAFLYKDKHGNEIGTYKDNAKTTLGACKANCMEDDQCSGISYGKTGINECPNCYRECWLHYRISSNVMTKKTTGFDVYIIPQRIYGTY